MNEAGEPDALTLLREGEVQVRGRLPWSSNGTYLVDLCLGGTASLAVYKPGRRERPLWDFPDGLYHREVAAYLLSEALGWHVVPETVAREDAPYGPGSLQRFVHYDVEHHYFTLLERPAHHDALRTICAFDLVANNADRKGGHCLLGEDGRIWAIDHGLCFHTDPKLRTVIWDFGGQPVPEELLPALAALAEEVPAALTAVLDDEEVEMLGRRAAAIVRRPVFPEAGARMHYPWPLI